MTDQPYNRTIIYPLEKPLADDVNQQFSQADMALRETMFNLLHQRSGFLGTGFLLTASGPPALSVVLKAGLGYQDAPTDVPTAIGGVVGLNDLSRYKPIVLQTDLTVAVPAPPGAQSRIDLIEVRYNRALDNPQSRDFLDPLTSAFSPATVSKTLDFNVDGTLAYYAAAAVPTTALAYKSGVQAAFPVAPTVDTGYMALATILVVSGVVVINTVDITLLRAVIGGGLYYGRQVFTANGTYTPTPGTTRARLTMCGGGGGGAGLIGVGGQLTIGPGGSSGITLTKTIDGRGVPLTGGAVVVGALGAGGAAGGLNPGANGGDSTIVLNGVTYTAKGGLGAAAPINSALTSSIPSITDTQAGSGPSSDGVAGDPSGLAIGVNTGGNLSAQGGNGGSGSLGKAGLGGNLVMTATAASGNGAGGGGAGWAGAGNKAGGDGAPGVAFVDEWT